MTPPLCQRCQSDATHWYRCAYAGGFHVGVYCVACDAPAACKWYAHRLFTPDEIAAMPTMTPDDVPDPRQGKLFT